MYSLKQALCAWYTQTNEWFHGKCVNNSYVDANLYFLCDGDNIMIGVLYVDYIILSRNYDELIQWLKNELCQEFEMKDLGPLHYCLGYKMEGCEPMCIRTNPCVKLRDDDLSKDVDATLHR